MIARLQNMEKDLNLLTAFQSLLLTGSENERESATANKTIEIPERDSNGKQSAKGAVPIRNTPTTFTKGVKRTFTCANDIPVTTRNNNIAHKESSSHFSNGNEVNGYGNANGEDFMEQEMIFREIENKLKHQLNIYKEKCVELELGTKLSLCNLEKAKDELSKERDVKRTLLVGTLQLKNKIQSYETRCNILNAESEQNKKEKLEFIQKLETMEKEKTEIELQTATQLDRLRLEKGSLENDNQLLHGNLQTLQRQFEELQKQCTATESNLNEQDRKSSSQLSKMVTKCAQIHKEREKISSEMAKIVEKSKRLEEELTHMRIHLREMKGLRESDKVQYDCNVKKLGAQNALEKQRIDEQLRACHNVLVRAKSTFMRFHQERHETSFTLKKTQEGLREANHNREIMRKNAAVYEMKYGEMKTRLNSTLMENMEKVQKLEKEIVSLQNDLKICISDKASVTKTLSRMKNAFSLERKEFCEIKMNFEKEKGKIGEEQNRLQQNYQIIQKVSEDQGHTIQKLRGDLEELRKSKFSLESQLRERDVDEKVLVRKLDAETRSCSRLEDQLEELQCRLGEMEEDLKGHSCQDFVDSVYSEKLDRIEEKLKARYAAWQEALCSSKSERDQAVTAARKAKMQLEEAKAKAENHVLEIISCSRQETVKLQTENHRLSSEKANKIYELESELERLKQQSTQMQRSLSAKIQQLQCALNIYLGSNSAAFSSGIGPANTGFGNIFM